MSTDDRPDADRSTPARWPVTRWVARLVAYCLSALVVAATAWLALWLLLLVPFVTFAVVAALLLAALLHPLARTLARVVPRSLAALVSVLLLLALPGVVVFFVGRQTLRQLDDLQSSVTSGLDRLRELLVSPPLDLPPQQVTELRNALADFAMGILPTPRAGATLALHVLTGLAVALFVLFFLLKDGPSLWRWFVVRTPARHRQRVDGAGERAWDTLTSYTRGVLVVASIDALGIGTALFLLGVPLALSLTALTFLGAFIPIVGALITGAFAVLVTLVFEGGVEALIVLGVVLLVQQVEGNLLHPLIMGRALHLHPVVILLAVTIGSVLAGVAGAVVAVPLVAVVYRVVDHLAGWDALDSDDDEDEDEDEEDDGPAPPADRTDSSTPTEPEPVR